MIIKGTNQMISSTFIVVAVVVAVECILFISMNMRRPLHEYVGLQYIILHTRIRILI